MTDWKDPIFITKLVASSIGGIFVYLIGPQNLSAFLAVGCLGIIDTLFALYLLAKKGERLSSKRAYDKPKTIAVYAGVIMTMNLMTRINEKFGMAVDAAIIWAGASEAISILEHAADLGYKIPLPLLKNLQKETK